jgi:hypothetical protein
MHTGRDGLTPIAFTCPAPAGAKLSFLWRANPDGAEPGSIDKSHKGPCAVYLKAMPSMSTTPPEGDGWFKVWGEGYDSTARKWCTEKLIANNGFLSVALPPSLPGGQYLARAELLALHNAGEPQFYIGCAQIFVAGPASGPPSIPSDHMASIPGYVHAGDRSVTFNIYNSRSATPASYPVPGPPAWTPSASATAAQQAVQIEGKIPEDCIVKNANWCGVEVPQYTNEASCWRSSENCSKQEGECYRQAPPSGEANCEVFASHCQKIQGECSARRFKGPPEKGAKLGEVFAPFQGVPPAAGT